MNKLKLGGIIAAVISIVTAGITAIDKSNVLDAKVQANKEYIQRVDKRFERIEVKLDTIILKLHNKVNR